MSIDLESLNRAFQALLPARASGALDWAPQDPVFSYPEEAAQVEDAAPKRQAEFLGGRICARNAMAALGLPECAILNDSDRVPLWPEGVVASISHCRGLCGAVVASSEHYLGLGLDIERTNRLSDSARQRVMHANEAARAGKDLQAHGSLLFSAKEAFYKTQYRLFGASPAFHDLQLLVDFNAGQLSVLDASGLAPELGNAARKMQFRFCLVDELVLTVCWLSKGSEDTMKPKSLQSA